MKTNPGQILPIQQNFWPESSRNIVQAIITRQTDQFIELCPVHANIEAAGFFDLIIRGGTIESGVDMVVMCRDSAEFPINAVNHEPDEFDFGPMLTETESRKILADMQKLMQHHEGKEAFSVLRGMPLPADSKAKKIAESIRSEWKKFRLAAMCAAAKAQENNVPAYLNLREFLDFTARILKDLVQPLKDAALQPTGALAAKAKLKIEEEDKIRKFKQNLSKEIRGDLPDQERLQRLLSNDDPADLLEATLRIYQAKKRDI